MIPLTHDFPVHSTVLVTRTFVPFREAHVKHVLVFTLKTPPLGTSGVRVVVRTETAVSKSQTLEFVCNVALRLFRPDRAVEWLDIRRRANQMLVLLFRMPLRRFEVYPSAPRKTLRALTFELLIIRHELFQPARIEHEIIRLLWRSRKCCVHGDLWVMRPHTHTA